MAESKDGPNEGPESFKKSEEWSDSQEAHLPKEIAWEKAPGHDWYVAYQFDGEEVEEMCVFGCMTAEKALEEARYSLNGFNNMNEGQYVIFAVKRTDNV